MSALSKVGAGLSLLGAVGCSNAPEPPTEKWTAPTGSWVEVWRDDFDGPAHGAPDDAFWNVEVRPTAFNDELQYTTNERKNSFLDGHGHLVIRAYQENYVDQNGAKSAQPYTSARLNTAGKVEHTYGRFEARIKLPQGGKGVWPAFWMLGNDHHELGWPECGEVDIMEMGGSNPRLIDGSLHGPGYSAGNAYHNYYELASGSFGDDFHVFTFEWTEDATRWLVDGTQYYVKTREGIELSGHRWVYDHPFYIIVNLAIGGVYDGDPDSSTVFPQEMSIDYITISKLGE